LKIALSSVKEKQIRDAVKKFFEGQGYFVPSGEFNIGVRPDVVAFKWSTEYEIEAIAVECKKTRQSHSLIEAGRTQARQYQQAFPHVYIACPKLGAPHLESVKSALGNLRMGLLVVNTVGRGHVTKEHDAGVSPRLAYDDYLFKTRQRGAAVLAYRDFPGVKDFQANLRDADIVWCWTMEAANFLLGNGDADRDYSFGICIEQKSNVEKTLGRVDASELYRLIKTLPEDYLVYLDYIDAYQPRQVGWRLLAKQVTSLVEKDVEWIKERSRRERGKYASDCTERRGGRMSC
jgi:hypothetical protein